MTAHFNYMKRLFTALALSLAAYAVNAGNLTPILMDDGSQKMVCDGIGRYMNTVQLTNQTVVGSYLFGNLVTNPSYGADVAIVASQYGSAPLGDLHIFNTTSTGGRQGEHERMFPAGDGVLVSGPVNIAAICWGGGTLEIYAVIWVR